MADEDNDNEEKKGKPILKILLLVVGILLLLGGAVFGTLFATGFFDKPAMTAEQMLASAEDDIDAAAPAATVDADGRAVQPPPSSSRPQPKTTEPLTRFEHTYLEVEREFLVNISSSRKVMQVQIALMTRYDNRVFDNFHKHEFAVRSMVLDTMRQTTEADTVKPEFRVELSEKIREAINVTLERFEDFGGVEEVYFTTFVIQ